jgi:hypothetical protein
MLETQETESESTIDTATEGSMPHELEVNALPDRVSASGNTCVQPRFTSNFLGSHCKC